MDVAFATELGYRTVYGDTAHHGNEMCIRDRTLIMCTAAYEMKRLGLANKPMILALKANVQEIAPVSYTHLGESLAELHQGKGQLRTHFPPVGRSHCRQSITAENSGTLRPVI